MKVQQHVFMALLVVFVLGDISHIINSMSGNHQTSVGLQGADAMAGRVLGKAILRALKKSAKSKSKKKSSGGCEHTKGKRPSTKGKHEKGQSRKDRDQGRANKKQKGGKDGSKKRPGGN